MNRMNELKKEELHMKKEKLTTRIILLLLERYDTVVDLLLAMEDEEAPPRVSGGVKGDIRYLCTSVARRDPYR